MVPQPADWLPDHSPFQNRPLLTRASGTIAGLTHMPFTSTNVCLEKAEHYRRAKELARDDFTHRYLGQIERGYRILAASEAASAASKKVQETRKNARGA